MRIIRISTDNEISIHDFPSGGLPEQDRALRGLIGLHCETLEHVLPRRLYTELMVPRRVMREKGGFVSMLVDEDGAAHGLDTNIAGSYLYETDRHGWPIRGNILFVGEKLADGGVEFCGISPKLYKMLYQRLRKIVEEARAQA